jgi:hypothetical protein
LSGLVKGKSSEVPRWLFVAGLLTGGMALKTLYPSGTIRTHARTHARMHACTCAPSTHAHAWTDSHKVFAAGLPAQKHTLTQKHTLNSRAHTYTRRAGCSRNAHVARRRRRASSRSWSHAGHYLSKVLYSDFFSVNVLGR